MEFQKLTQPTQWSTVEKEAEDITWLAKSKDFLAPTEDPLPT